MILSKMEEEGRLPVAFKKYTKATLIFVWKTERPFGLWRHVFNYCVKRKQEKGNI
jgi:hypothetical protein